MYIATPPLLLRILFLHIQLYPYIHKTVWHLEKYFDHATGLLCVLNDHILRKVTGY